MTATTMNQTAMSDDAVGLGVAAAVGAGAKWLVDRLLGQPDKTAALEARVMALESALNGPITGLVRVVDQMRTATEGLARAVDKIEVRLETLEKGD